MIQMLKNKLLIIIAALTLSVPAIIPLQASAAGCPTNTVAKNVASAVSSVTGQSPCNGGSNLNQGVKNIAKEVINIFSIIVGVVSVFFIIYAGFRYVTSGGESGSVSNAQNTLIYAIVGLVIVVLAQLIVHYVLTTANTFTTPPTTPTH